MSCNVKLVHLSNARSAIKGIDRGEPLRVPGVACVLLADDLPQPIARFGPAFADRPILATGETKFFGEPVAAVVAETRDAAEAAAALVQVEAEALPAVLSLEQALDPQSALVQDPSLRPGDPLAHSNVLREWPFGGHTAAVAADGIDTNYQFHGDQCRYRAARLRAAPMVTV